MEIVNLGDRVKDSVSGFSGIAVGRYVFLHGCTRICVQPEKLNEGKLIESVTFDEPQLEIVKRGVIKTGSRDTGGPVPYPPQRRNDPPAR